MVSNRLMNFKVIYIYSNITNKNKELKEYFVQDKSMIIFKINKLIVYNIRFCVGQDFKIFSFVFNKFIIIFDKTKQINELLNNNLKS